MNRQEFNDALYLAHYGTKGMHWGVRNYQNYDGSLTPEGRARYQENEGNGFSTTKSPEEIRNKRLKIAAGVATGAVAVTAAVLIGRKIYKSKGAKMASTPLKDAIKSGAVNKGKLWIDTAPMGLTLHPNTDPGVDYNAQILKNIHEMRKILSK